MNVRDQKGFTLTEILVVIGIIGVICAFAIPALSTSKLDANDKATKGSLYSLNLGLARAYKDKDPQFQPGGLLHKNSTNAVMAAAYLVDKGYVR